MLLASHTRREGRCRLSGYKLMLPLIAWCLIVTTTRCDEPLPKGTLSGKIVDARNRPISSATIRINTYDEMVLAEGRSGPDGHFRLGPIEPVYRHHADVIVEAEGLARQYVLGGTYSVFPGADFDLGDIRMDRGCTFSGQVLDHDGTPVPNAVIECVVDRRYLGHTVMPVGSAQVVKTDTSGRFRTPPMRTGERTVYVRVPHRRLAWVEPPSAALGEHTLPAITLQRDMPIYGTITSNRGEPLEGVRVEANADGARATSDAAGKFVLRGFGARPRFQLQASKEGYVFINWAVKGGDDGLRWHEVGGDGKEHGPFERLTVVMQSTAWIAGKAVDEATGQPVPLDKVVLCFFHRKPDGEVVLNGCRDSRFEQPQPGFFRVPYSSAAEYHLALSAKGYHDAEAFTPPVASLKPIENILVKMRKKDDRSAAILKRQTISGLVTKNGRPLETGWVGLCEARARRMNVVNAYIQRGRTVAADAVVYASAPIRQGKYVLGVPFQHDAYYLVVEAPGDAPTQVGPCGIALGEEKPVDIACAKGGALCGQVKNRPRGWEDDLWVVAFTDTGIRAETRVQRDGGFALRKLPAGRYGLKVGYDGYNDSEVPQGSDIPADAWKTNAEPWKRATVVELSAGEQVDGIELEFPPSQ